MNRTLQPWNKLLDQCVCAKSKGNDNCLRSNPFQFKFRACTGYIPLKGMGGKKE